MAKKTESKTEEVVDKPKALNFQKKISTAKIVGRLTARSVEVGQEKDLYEVVGIASGSKCGDSDYGPWTALTGKFAAVNLETGEKFRSGVLFLPDVALDPIMGELNAGAQSVEFGWVIGITGDESVQVGYTYYARPTIEPDATDPLERLTSNMTKIEHKPES